MLGVYTRLSKLDDASNSIDNQKREATEFRLKNDITSFQLYNEGEGLSGTKDETQRPQLKKLIDDIQSGKITSVWMRKQDRLARSGLIVLTFADTARKNDIQLIFGDKGIVDLNDPVEYFQLTIMSAVDELKPRQQSKGTIKALTDNIKEGKAWGIIPYGYKTKDMMPYVDEEQAKIINLIFDLYLEGKGLLVISDKLNNLKIPTKYTEIHKQDNHKKLTNNKSGLWSSSLIHRIIKNTWYNGKRTFQKVEYDVPRIIDEVKFLKVQKANHNRKHKRFNDTTKRNFLLRSLMKCHKCDSNFVGRINPASGDRLYHCSSKRSSVTNCGSASVNLYKFDSFIIKHLFKSKDLLNTIKQVQSSNELTIQVKNKLEITKEKLVVQEKKVLNYAKLLGGDLEDDDLIINYYVNAKKQVTKLKEDITELKLESQQLQDDEALSNLEERFKNFDIKSDFLTIKEAVHSIIEKITILSDKDKNNQLYYIIKIEYKGFNQTSIFLTVRPFKKWSHLSEVRDEPTQQELQDDIELTEFIYGIKISKDKYHLHKSDSYSNNPEFMSNIVLDKSDIINFNLIKSTRKNY